MATVTKIDAPRQTYPWWINAVLLVMLIGLITAIVWVLINPATSGFVPVAAQSNLRADYGVDPLNVPPLAALNLQIVEDALEDLRPTRPPENNSTDGLATATVPAILQQLLTPVATLTPQPGETQATARPSATATATSTPTPSETPIPPTATPSNTATFIPTSTNTPLVSPTRTSTVRPSHTATSLFTPTLFFTFTPTSQFNQPTNTPLPNQPTNTPIPAQPTSTSVPPTNTQPPPPPATNTPDPYVGPPSTTTPNPYP